MCAGHPGGTEEDITPGGVGISSSLYGAAYGSASMIAGAITGVTASALGLGNVFWVCAALSAIAALGMLARHALGRRSAPPSPGERSGFSGPGTA